MDGKIVDGGIYYWGDVLNGVNCHGCKPTSRHLPCDPLFSFSQKSLSSEK
jgi:hypothetical protein